MNAEEYIAAGSVSSGGASGSSGWRGIAYIATSTASAAALLAMGVGHLIHRRRAKA